MIEIRRMCTGDDSLVQDAAHLFDDGMLDEEAIQTALGNPQHYLFLAYVHAAPVGMLRAFELERFDTTRRQMFLYEIGVDPQFQRQGVGRALIEALKDVCRERCFLEIFVLTDRANAAAMRLYASTGGEESTADDVMFVYPFG